MVSNLALAQIVTALVHQTVPLQCRIGPELEGVCRLQNEHLQCEHCPQPNLVKQAE